MVSESGTKTDLDQLKGSFLASLNHEIRTPLSGILGMADLLLETRLDEEQRDPLDGVAHLLLESRGIANPRREQARPELSLQRLT